MRTPDEQLLAEEGEVGGVIKPLLEGGREQVEKKGVVRDKTVLLDVIRHVITYAVGIGVQVLNLEFSPIKGPEGNIEYLLHLQNHKEGTVWEQVPVDPRGIVDLAHQTL